LSKMGGGVCRPSAQYTLNFETTVCSGENTKELRIAVSSMLHSDVEKQNPYCFKN